MAEDEEPPTTGDDAGDELPAEGGGLEIPPQTPLFRAVNLARYRRQELIKAVQAHTGRKLITYVADLSAAMTREDAVPLMDLLHQVDTGTDIDFLLQTPGGDVDAADKIVRILRKRVGEKGTLRVVVPDCAKSAGTLLALGAHLIVMSDSSELGPIDPQIIAPGSAGQPTRRPAHTYVDGYDALVAKIDDPASYADGKDTKAEQLLLNKCDPALLDLCRQAIRRSRRLAEKLLKQGMLQEGAWSEVAGRLTDNETFLSQHGAVIDYQDAIDLGLSVEYLEPNSKVWQAYWRLYCEERLALTAEVPKLFESDYASLPFDS
ncbi:MAG: hypothetical protein M0020_00775 [Actinomycetota bacterium]|nr:hypothetical protein [Actinomycetota bacterium]